MAACFPYTIVGERGHVAFRTSAPPGLRTPSNVTAVPPRYAGTHGRPVTRHLRVTSACLHGRRPPRRESSPEAQARRLRDAPAIRGRTVAVRGYLLENVRQIADSPERSSMEVVRSHLRPFTDYLAQYVGAYAEKGSSQ
jgi:hypothetical protein